MRFRSNEEVINYLFSRRRMNIKLGLDSINRLLEKLGSPETHFRSIHVAGTNGKGSTCAILESIFLSNGLKTGLYTSPHLTDARERIRIDGKSVSLDLFKKTIELLFSTIEKYGCSFFEILTAIAFAHFCDQQVDIAIIETGLGGRLDATNDILDVFVTSYKTMEENEIPRICSAMNDYFLDMIQADPEHSIIRRADVTNAYDIAVYGPEDRLLDTDIDLNGASRRALTLAFILALAEVSGVKAPNVIDTPLGMMSGIVKQSVLRTAVNHTVQLVLFLTRDEISGCQDIIDQYAGTVYTLTNSAHYPKQLINNPDGSYSKMIRCDCNHRQYCNVCERIGDSNSLELNKR